MGTYAAICCSAIRSNVVHCHKHHVAYGNQAFIASTACALADTGRWAVGLPFNHRLPVLPPDLHCKLQIQNPLPTPGSHLRSTKEPFTMQEGVPRRPQQKCNCSIYALMHGSHYLQSYGNKDCETVVENAITSCQLIYASAAESCWASCLPAQW